MTDISMIVFYEFLASVAYRSSGSRKRFHLMNSSSRYISVCFIYVIGLCVDIIWYKIKKKKRIDMYHWVYDRIFVSCIT